jgi:voltage-dependent calcium channel
MARLEEFLRRRARLQRVEEAVRRNVVVGFFDTLYWSRRFRRAIKDKRASRMAQPPELTVPEIFVDDITTADKHSVTPGAQSPVELAPTYGTTSIDFGAANSAHQDAIMRSRSNSIQLTPSPSPTRSSPQLSPRQLPTDPIATTDFAASGLGSGSLFSPPPPSPTGPPSEEARSRANSNVSAQDVLEALDNSVWGQSIRRSFTLRRPPPGSRQ